MWVYFKGFERIDRNFWTFSVPCPDEDAMVCIECKCDNSTGFNTCRPKSACPKPVTTASIIKEKDKHCKFLLQLKVVYFLNMKSNVWNIISSKMSIRSKSNCSMYHLWMLRRRRRSLRHVLCGKLLRDNYTRFNNFKAIKK